MIFLKKNILFHHDQIILVQWWETESNFEIVIALKNPSIWQFPVNDDGKIDSNCFFLPDKYPDKKSYLSEA